MHEGERNSSNDMKLILHACRGYPVSAASDLFNPSQGSEHQSIDLNGTENKLRIVTNMT